MPPMPGIRRRLKSFVRRSDGNIVTTFALTMPIVIGIGTMAVDYTNFSGQRSLMQAAADDAALAAAREMHLAQWTESAAAETVRNFVRATLDRSQAGKNATEVTKITDNGTALRVQINAWIPSFFGDLFPSSMHQISVGAVARQTGGAPICVIALERSSTGAIHLQDNATLTARKCAVYSDSKSPQGVQATDNSALLSTLTCSTGGKVGGPKNFNPMPLTDCPAVPDPLASRPPPSVGACTPAPSVVDTIAILHPGTYCGGLRIKGGAVVTLLPGVYVIKDGPLTVDSLGAIVGVNVGFYLVGKNATVLFDKGSAISLIAPKIGPMSGILLYEDRGAAAKQQHRISSDDAPLLLGTIYIPNGRLIVDANKPIAFKSAYTIIVAGTLELYSGPNLVMNTNYNASDVPVPLGVGVVGGGSVLVQ
jgi:hypothetical protein